MVLLVLLTGPVAAQDKPLRGIALVIGESKYEQLPVLANPQKDARDIDRLLGDLGFEVDRVLNADGEEMRDAISRFTSEAKDADVALVYYSGHGIEAKGENFLAPTDTDVTSPEAAGASMIAVQPLLEALSQAAPVTIILLDACRSDPFPPGQMILLPGEAAPVAVVSEGLAAVRGPKAIATASKAADSLGTVIGFAAEPGEPALDGAPGENSPYAAALLKHFAAGGYAFGDVMTMVSEEVYLKTKAKQLPWVNSSLRRVLTFGAPEPDDDPDHAAIRTERRKLLLSIASTPTPTRSYVETLASQEAVPLDALYGMLDVLGVKTAGGGNDLEQQLQKGATKLKQLMAEKSTAVKADPELERLSKLAEDAEAEGAIALALKYRDEASGRADTLLKGKQAEADRLKQDMLDIASTYAANAATALLNFDHVHAAELYGKAYDAVKDWDKTQALTYKIGQGDALYDEGYYTARNAPLETALTVYAEAQTLAPRDGDPSRWAELQDRVGQAQQVLGERFAEDTMLQEAVKSYRAALEVRSRAAMPIQWATTQNNLGNALYTIGLRTRDQAMLREAIAALDAALEVFTHAAAPAKWSVTQSNRAAVKVDLANFVYAATDNAEMAAAASGNTDATNIPEVVKARAEANAILSDAIAALEDAAATEGKSADRLDWAMLMHTLATAYEQRGEMNHAPADLEKSVETYEAVLTVHTRERTPAQWVRSSNNLAITLKHLADETNDSAPIKRAVSVYEAVVAATSREVQPLDWADYEENLGNALAGLAGYEDAIANLDKAMAAYRAAGEVTTLDRGASKWQGLQTAMATTLMMRGIKALNKQDILEAQQITLKARDTLASIGKPDEAFYSQYLPLVDKVLAMFP